MPVSKNKVDRNFQDIFRCGTDVSTHAPGKIEVLGNHTDYNEGFGLSTTAEFRTCFDLELYDYRKFEVIDKIKIPSDYVFVIVNSMVKHAFTESDYNLRKESCKRAVECIKKKYPQIKALRDVSPAILRNTKRLMDFTDYKRASHIVSENDLVLKGMEALKNSNIELFGSYLYLSHESSRKNFENSCPELDYLVELSKSIPGCVGARLSGRGFGGISIHLVKKKEADRYKIRIATTFKLQTNIEPKIIIL